jgi:hypothetical protein
VKLGIASGEKVWQPHAMGTLSPHRRFVDPLNTDGIPTARSHRPVPARDKPLPGTKTLKTPKEGSLRELLGRREPGNVMPDQSAALLGWSAMVFSIGYLVMLVLKNHVPEAEWFGSELMSVLAVFSLGFIHLLAIFSQILSSGKNLPGALAVPVLYAGLLLFVILDHFFL